MNYRNKLEIVTNYKNKDRGFLYGAIFLNIFSGVLVIGCFIAEFLIIKQALLYNVLSLLFLLVAPLIIHLFFYKSIYSQIVLADSATFDITFYYDRFDYIGLFKNKKTINYTQVDSLSKLTLWIHGRGVYTEIDILQITLKDNKRIQLCCNALSIQNAGKLSRDLTTYTGMHLYFSRKYLLFFK